MKDNLDKKINSFKSNWYIWFFPIIALGICIWLFKDYYDKRGPTIQILFDDATGIQVDKTRVRFRGVTIGVVKNVTVTDDTQDVVVDVALNRDAKDFAVKGTKFWLVLPKVGFQGISGLETIIEGTYISVQPGKKGGENELRFKGQRGKDTNEPLDDTVSYTVITKNSDSINVGDSVTYRGLKVGSVTKVTLQKSGQLINVVINIENRYTRLIRTNTQFWRKVAVQAKLGLFNSELKINSFESLLNSGIEIATPNEAGAMAKAGAEFGLTSAPPKEFEKWNPVLEFP